MITIELTAAVDAAGTLQTFYLCTDSFVTGAADTPAHTAFLPVLIDPGSIGIHAYSDGQTAGATKLEIGEITIANADGALDGWLNYSFDGRPAVIRIGSGGAYPNSFSKVLTATVQSIEVNWKQITVQLRDKQWLFDLPLLTARYGGTNVLPNGIDGTAADIKGQAKPRIYGKVLNVAPAMVNTSKLIYQLSDRALASVNGVYDGGSAITAGTNYSTNAALQAATTAAGTYDTCLAEGLIRLGTKVTYTLTADATASGVLTAAEILSQVVQDAGLTSAEVSAADVTALASAASATVGVYVNDASTTSLEVLDSVAASNSAWFGFDKDGVMRMGRLSEPTGTPVITLYDYDIGDTIERRPLKDNGVPVYRVTVGHSKNYTVQSSGIATSVTAARVAVLGLGNLTEKVEDTSIKTQWLMAKENAVSTLLTSSADANTEATRLLGLYKVRRDLFDVPVDISVLVDNGLKVMDIVAVQLNRFGMTSGKQFRILGMRLELGRAIVTLTLWG